MVSSLLDQDNDDSSEGSQSGRTVRTDTLGRRPQARFGGGCAKQARRVALRVPERTVRSVCAGRMAPLETFERRYTDGLGCANMMKKSQCNGLFQPNEI